jgi:hypothetical protein
LLKLDAVNQKACVAVVITIAWETEDPGSHPARV